MVGVDDLKAWIGLNVDTYDALLTGLESRAVAVLEAEADRHFGDVGSVTEYIEGTGTRNLWLAEPPSTDPTSVTERSYPGDTSEETIAATDDDGFVVRSTDREGWLVRKGGYRWTKGTEYEVTYQRGYTAEAEPADVRQAVIDIVARTFQRRGSEGLKSESVGGYAYTVADDAGELVISPFVASVIRTWRRPHR